MAERKPPRLCNDERETLCALLQYQRDSFVRKVTGVSDHDARKAFVASGTSLLWLMNHMAEAERTWVVQRFAATDPGLNRASRSLAEAVERYRQTWSTVDAIVDACPTLDEMCRDTGDNQPTNLRWVLMHLLEETARRAGHADITRELIDGSTGR